jgi:hypothetical protein
MNRDKREATDNHKTLPDQCRVRKRNVIEQPNPGILATLSIILDYSLLLTYWSLLARVRSARRGQHSASSLMNLALRSSLTKTYIEQYKPTSSIIQIKIRLDDC